MNGNNYYKKQKAAIRGLTFVEMIIVMVVVQILAAMAVPLYRDYLIKAKWAELIVITENMANRALLCLQIHGTTCSGVTGYADPPDIDMGDWPISQYAYRFEIFFGPPGVGFHIVAVSRPELGGYRYDRGFTKYGTATSYTVTKSYRDSMPDWIIRDVPIDTF